MIRGVEMKQVLLSIIVPCYNSFSLMEKNLKWISKYLNDECEVIFVDDCSTDDTFDKLKKYCTDSEKKVSVIKNECNGGPGISRNNGLQRAKGEYVTFLDSDDFFSEEFMKIIPMELKSRKYDCVLFDYNYYFSETKQYQNSIFMISDKLALDNGKMIVLSRGGTWGKIYKRDILEDHKITFLAQKRGEDVAFTKSALSFCDTFKYINKPLYNYVQHEKSLMHDQSLES